MGYSNLHNLVGMSGGAGAFGAAGSGGAGGFTRGGGGGAGSFDGSGYVLVQQRLQEWEWHCRFIEMNPDIKERWEQHKTYEILKNEQLS